MGFSHGKDTRIFINGRDLSTMFMSAKLPMEVDMAETSTFGTGAKTYVAGMRDATVSLEGRFDGDPGQVDVVLAGLLGAAANSGLTVYPQGEVLGSVAKSCPFHESSYEVDAEIGDMVGVSAELQSIAAIETGYCLHTIAAAETADGEGSGVDGGAQTTNGGVAYLHVTGYSGFTSVVVNVQDSADGATGWATILAMTAVTAVNAWERKTVAGTVRRYTRANWDVTGSGTITFSLAFGRF